MEEANSAVCTHLESITAAAREVLLETEYGRLQQQR